MTEKEYVKWANNLYNLNEKIRECERKLENVVSVYDGISDKDFKINCLKIDIQLQYHNDYLHKYYLTESKEMINCVKSEIKDEIKMYEELICSYKKEKEELLNSLSIKKE